MGKRVGGISQVFDRRAHIHELLPEVQHHRGLNLTRVADLLPLTLDQFGKLVRCQIPVRRRGNFNAFGAELERRSLHGLIVAAMSVEQQNVAEPCRHMQVTISRST